MATLHGRRRATPLNKNLKHLLNSDWTELLLRWAFGMIFIYASYHKIADPAAFAKVIYGYGLFPGISINLIAIIIPFLELITGLALISGTYVRSATLILEGMLLAFIFVISVNLIRGHEFDCGCFSLGEAGQTSSALQLLIRDILSFIFGLKLLFYKGQRIWCVFPSDTSLKDRNEDFEKAILN